MNLRQFFELNERYVNIINDEETKRKYAKDVWDILQKSYADIGGIKGSGFGSIDDMIKNIPFWKLSVHNKVVDAVALYKDKGGRKLVATGYNGSEVGRLAVTEMARADLQRSYGEKSKGALGSLMKSLPWDVLKNFMLKPKETDKIKPIKGMDIKDLPDDAQYTLKRYPQLIDYGYLRTIGDEWVFKVSVGTPGKTIKQQLHDMFINS